MSGSDQPSKPTVLVVEDEWLVRQDIVGYLSAAGFVTVEAGSGEAAMALLQRRDGLDLLFTDIRLGGGVNGWDVAEAFRRMYPDLPVIYTSGAPLPPERPVPGSAFLAKPCDPQSVLAAMRKLSKD